MNILKLWQTCNAFPGGRRIFQILFAFKVPYSGSIRPNILSLKAGHCVVELKDRPFVRNHLKSIHAIALANLGEMASGLAFISALSSDYQAIVKSLSIEFKKKARGKIRAESVCDLSEFADSGEYDAKAVMTDRSGDVVAEIAVHWTYRKKAK